MPVVPFIPLIAAGIGAAGGIASSKIKAKSAASNTSNALSTPTDPLGMLVESQRKLSESAAKNAEQDIVSARRQFGVADNFLDTILNGSPDKLMQFLDVGGATKSMDENEQIAAELGVRGGRRAATIGGASFSRDAALNNLLKQLKFAAPNQVMQLGQMYGNLGSTEYSAATSAAGQATQALINEQQIKAQEAATKAGMIGDILGVGGGIAAVLLKRKSGGDDDGGGIYDDPTSRYPASPDSPIDWGTPLFGGT